MSIQPGDRVGSYEIVSLLGSGGMGEVWRAHDPRIDRDVAVKVLLGEVAEDADRLARFEQEARAAGALNHPNILTVFELGSHEGRPYLVTELLDGASLRERLEPRARRRLRRAAAGAHAPWSSGRRSRPASPRRTTRGSSTATSSPRTSS